MINNELLTFIKESKNNGITDDNIRTSLSEQGWAAADIDEGLYIVTSEMTGQTLPAVTLLINQPQNST